MFNLLRLLRFPNLLVVVLTQALVYFRVIRPALTEAGVATSLSPIHFWLLTGATVAVTAGGYVINDLLDVRSDIINRPGKNVVYHLGEGRVRWLYLILVFIGFAMSVLLGWLVGEIKLLWLYPFSVALLALYSRFVKPYPFAGNLLVALYCAGVPGLVALAERASIARLLDIDPSGAGLVRIIGVYCLFAFIATLLREVVKDMQDVRGDRVIGRDTLAVRWGIEGSRRFSLLLAAITLAALLSPLFLGWTNFLTPEVLAMIAALVSSLCFLAILIARGRESADFGRISRGLKLFLLGGLGLLLFI